MLADPVVTVLGDPAGVIAAAERRFRAAAAEAIAARGRFAVALSGGRTPNGLYAALARAAPPLDWRHIHLFWGDERCVPPDHPDSNFGTAMKALAGADIPPANLHRIAAETSPAARGAAAYEATLRAFFATPEGVPRFDLVLLGLGPDGHTASLFPGSEALAERRRLVVETRVPALGVERITLTYPVLDAAREVVFLITGAEKAPMVHRLLGEPAASIPAAAVRPSQGALRVLLDAAAASLSSRAQ